MPFQFGSGDPWEVSVNVLRGAAPGVCICGYYLWGHTAAWSVVLLLGVNCDQLNGFAANVGVGMCLSLFFMQACIQWLWIASGG